MTPIHPATRWESGGGQGGTVPLVQGQRVSSSAASLSSGDFLSALLLPSALLGLKPTSIRFTYFWWRAGVVVGSEGHGRRLEKERGKPGLSSPALRVPPRPWIHQKNER